MVLPEPGPAPNNVLQCHTWASQKQGVTRQKGDHTTVLTGMLTSPSSIGPTATFRVM